MTGRLIAPTPPLALERAARVAVLAIAGLSVFMAAWLVVMHLTSDPMVDVRAYYDAAARLNAGQALYPATEGATGLYLYPPLIAIVFRPLALLPFQSAATIWEAVVVASMWLMLRRIGLGPRVQVALALLAMPIAWTVVIGQAEAVVTLLLAIGSPATVALAGHVKILPWLAAAYWVGRRDGRALLRFAAWVVVIGLVQLAIEPAGTIAYLRLEWLRPAFGVRNLSPYTVSPLLWAILIAVLLVLAIARARTKSGWAFATILVVLASPRLLLYQLGTLLAGFGGPERRGGSQAQADR